MGDSRLVNLSCPNCAGSLSVGSTQDVLTCGYCGASIQVERSGGEVSLSKLTDTMARLQRGADKSAAELALKRLADELRTAEAELGAFRHDASNAAASHAARIRAAGLRGVGFYLKIVLVPVAAFVVTYVGVGIPYIVTHPGYDPIPKYFLVIMGIAGLVVASIVTVVLLASGGGKRRARVRALTQERDVALRAHEEATAPAEAKVAMIKSKLAENRAIVDS